METINKTNENKIVIYNSSIRIYNFKSSENYQKFLNILSVWDTNKYDKKSKYVSWKAYSIVNDVLIIHKGISINLLKNYFPNFEILRDNKCSNVIKLKNRITMKRGIKPRDDLQKNSIEFLDKYSYDNKENDYKVTQKFLCLKPGSGKTFCTIRHLVKTKEISMVIVDNNKIMDQWIESFLTFTNINKDEIYLISGSPAIDKLLKEKERPYKVYLASHRTLDSYYSDDWKKINNLFETLGVGTKVFDEAHIEWRNIFHIDINSNVKNTIYLTATPSRSRENEIKVYSNLFDNIIMYGLEESRKEKYLISIDYVFNSNPTQKEISNMENFKGFDNNAFNNYLLGKIDLLTENLNKLLKLLYKKDPNNKIAIVVNCNNMILELKSKLEELYPDKSIGTFSGIIPNKEKREKELEKDIILTTVTGFNKGVDVEGLQSLISVSSISSKVLIEQLSGRLRYNKNYKSIFIQMTDLGFPQCIRHSNIRNRILESISKSFNRIKISK